MTQSSVNSQHILQSCLDLIANRQSVRAFLDKPVPPEFIRGILDVARWAPSGVNTQPWQVSVLGPTTQQTLSTALLKARESGQTENPDYHYYPTEWFEPYKSRRFACGMALYQSLGIARDDKVRRQAQWYENYRFFGAPVVMMIHIHQKLCQGSWMDLGLFIQNIMLAARAYGLETCPQAALAEYPDIVRDILSLDDSQTVVCGISMGYADWSQPIIQYRTERAPVDSFTNWLE